MLAHDEKILSLGADYVALLLPSTFTCSKSRVAFNAAHPFNAAYNLVPRPSCSSDGAVGTRDRTWFVWDATPTSARSRPRCSKRATARPVLTAARC